MSPQLGWSTISLMPSRSLYLSAIAVYCSGFFSLTRNDSGNDSGLVALTRSGASWNWVLKRCQAVSRLS